MAATTIRAIETAYAGCRFRSRLEARWAVFFDHLGIRWQYEPEGLEFDGIRYLPDFQIERPRLYVEVKGQLDAAGARKVLGLAEHRNVLLAMDIPRPGTPGPHFLHLSGTKDGVEAHHVSLVPKTVEPLTWTVMPFGWPSQHMWPDSDQSIKLLFHLVGLMPEMQGWILSNYVVDGALAAARSARFEAY